MEKLPHRRSSPFVRHEPQVTVQKSSFFKTSTVMADARLIVRAFALRLLRCGNTGKK